MDKFTTHTGTAVPMRRSNVDTDQIIPAVYLKRVSRTGFGDGLFAAWRSDPDFELNRPEYENASILVAGPQFGVGSSREHAVWSLLDYGFRVVVAESFGDIFRGNSLKAGLVTVQLRAETIVELWDIIAAEPSATVTVDLVQQRLRVVHTNNVWEREFKFDKYARWRFIEGLDDIGLSLRHAGEIKEFECRRQGWLPVTASTVAC